MPDSEMDFAVVIGKTMKLPQIADPSTADIDKYHELFLVAYQELFDRNKEQYAASGKDAVLEILWGLMTRTLTISIMLDF